MVNISFIVFTSHSEFHADAASGKRFYSLIHTALLSVVLSQCTPSLLKIYVSTNNSHYISHISFQKKLSYEDTCMHGSQACSFSILFGRVVYQEIRPRQHYFRLPFNHISPTFTIHLSTTRFRIVGKLLEVRQCDTQRRRRLNFPLQLCRVTEFRSLAALKGHTRSFQGRGKFTLSTICPIFKRFQLFLNSVTAVAQNFLSVS